MGQTDQAAVRCTDGRTYLQIDRWTDDWCPIGAPVSMTVTVTTNEVIIYWASMNLIDIFYYRHR